MRLTSILAACGLTAILAAPAGAQVIGPTIVVDAASGQVISSDRAGIPWYPASLTKMMTAYVALRQVRAGQMTMDTQLRVSPRAARAAPSKMHFRPGAVLTLDNALKMMMVRSANDVSITIAEGVGGNVENFVRMMNVEAQRLGMSATRFANPNGLPNPLQVSSARDMAMLARAMMREFDEHRLLWQIPAIQYGGRVIRNTNHLIGRYPGANGFKTGFICASGFNMVATATRGGRQLITVVMGATSARVRAEHAAGLFERGFAGGGTGTIVESIRNETHLAPANIRDQACRRRGRGPVFIETGEEFDNEPAAAATAEDAGNLSFAQMYAGPSRAQARSRAQAIVALTSAAPGQAIPSLLGPYRPSMAPIPVFIGGGRPPASQPTMVAAPPAAGLASSTTTIAAPVAAVGAAALAAPGAIGRPVTAAGAPQARAPGAIAPATGVTTAARAGAIAPAPARVPAVQPQAPTGAPLALQGVVPMPEARPARAGRSAQARPAQRAGQPPRAGQNRPAQSEQRRAQSAQPAAR